MKRFRVWMMLAALLATTTTVHAMSPSAASLRALLATAQAQTESACPYEASAPAEGGCPDCAASAEPTWFAQSVQQGVTAWRQLRTVCAKHASACEQEGDCCAAACAKTTAKACCPAAGCCTGIAACVKGLLAQAQTNRPGCCTSAAPCCEVVKAPTVGCCCAKACACCETCKEKKTASTPTQPFLTLPACPRVRQVMSGGCDGPLCLPAPPAPFCHAREPQKVLVPVALPDGSVRMVLAVSSPAPQAPQARQAHLATPGLEAHCERMTYLGDLVLLEGDVRLVCHKSGMPIRIEAPRVVLNMKDGTFTVESEVRPTRTSRSEVNQTSFGCTTVQRVQSWVAPAPGGVETTIRRVEVIPVPVYPNSYRPSRD